MLNVSTMAFQQRYDRRDDDDQYDPHVIEMKDSQVLNYLRNTWFFDLPLKSNQNENTKTFFVEECGFGHQFTIIANPFKSSQLKFVLINYIGFFEHQLPERTCKLSVL